MKKYSKPTLVLFCGLPGAGKTTLAKKLNKIGKGVRVCTDDWQADLGMNANPNNFHEKLQKRLYEHALELLRNNQSVILEDGLWMKHERDAKLTDAKSHNARTEMHYFDLSFDENWNRLEFRNKNLPHGAVHIDKEKLQVCWNKLQKPTSDELAQYDKVYVYKDDTELPE